MTSPCRVVDSPAIRLMINRPLRALKLRHVIAIGEQPVPQNGSAKGYSRVEDTVVILTGPKELGL